MNNEAVLAVLASVVVLGAALVAVLRTDRVRETRQQRLKAVTAMAPIGEQPTVSLRRPLRQRAALFSPLSALWARLDAALAATGNWIGVPHLVVTGVVAAAAAVLLADRVMRLNPVLVFVLAAAAAAAGPTLLLRLAQGRYQRHFLDAFPAAL